MLCLHLHWIAALRINFVKVSIITAARNSGSTISDTIKSVIAQTYTNFEHLVVDGCSTDDTVGIVKSFGHPGLILTSEHDDGIYDAMNKGLRQASGDVVGILNSDDYYVDANVLQEVVNLFKSDPSLEVVLGDVDLVEDVGCLTPLRRYRSAGFQPWMLRIGLMPPHPAVFVRKSAYERVGLYKYDYKIAADFDFLVRLLLIDGAKYLISGKHWVRMRTGGISTAGWRSNLLITREMLRSMRENNLFSCLPILFLRLPIKYFWQVLR